MITCLKASFVKVIVCFVFSMCSQILIHIFIHIHILHSIETNIFCMYHFRPLLLLVLEYGGRGGASIREDAFAPCCTKYDI